MANQAWLHTLPMLRPPRAMDVLGALGEDHRILGASGMLVLIRSDDQVNFMLPAEKNVSSKLRAAFGPARDRLFGLLTSVARINFDPHTNISNLRDTDDLVTLPVALGVLALLTGQQKGADDDTIEAAGQQLFLVEGTPSQIARAQSSLLLRVRDLTSIVEDESDDGQITAAFLGEDDIAQGAMPDGLDTVLENGGKLQRFRRWQFGRATLHLPHRLRLGDGVEDSLEKALPPHQDAFDGRELAIHQAEDGSICATWVKPDEAAPPADLIPEDHPDGDSWIIRERTMSPGAEAQAKLNKVIGADDFPVGYRIRLRRLQDDHYSGEAIEELQEEVDDLLVRIDLINALVPQARFDVLFRFTSRQLPALVDAMRRLPAERWNDGSVRYASGHPLGEDAAPIHYIMCAADVAGSVAAFPELIHAQATEDKPMRYAVDPVWAEYAAARDDVRASVYVPAHYTLSPSLGAFGGKLEETLRQVMGRKFRDIAEFVEDPKRAPIFLFSSERDGTARIGVEVIDAQDFVPLELRINWLNDYLQLLPPQIVKEQDLASVATDIYKGTVADEIHASAIAAETRIAGHWESFRTAREQELDAYAETLSTELAAATDYTARLLDHLRDLDKRVTSMERLVMAADKALAKADGQIEALADLPEDLAALRETLRSGLAEEIRRGETLTKAVKTRVEQQQAAYHDLRRGGSR